MCGRFTLRARPADLVEVFELLREPELTPRFNIAPTQPVAIVRQVDKHREISMVRWGLIPFWAEDPKVGYSTINARAETVAKKPTFRQSFAKRRCLIPADGFYEWQRMDGRKQPFFIHMKDDRPFAFAGLWDRWKRGDQAIESCSIIVSNANELVEPIHDRMPVILDQEDYARWLDPKNQDTAALQGLLRPYPAEGMTAFPISTLVNSPRNDQPECIERLSA
ncbi:MAG TPA: SOS response-associated peptidase [Planctomycetaceae bacterium]|nr:SOS response-associated peptidase [Planctomycetaceae bacterium]